MARGRPTALRTDQVDDDRTQRNLESIRRYITELERRVRDLEAAKHLPRMAEVSLSADQTTTSAGSHVEFDEADGVLVKEGLVKLATGSGQTNGIITLRGGRRYLIEGTVSGTLSDSTGAARLEWYVDGAQLTATATGVRPKRIFLLGNEVANNGSSEPHSAFLYEPPKDAELKLEIVSVAGTFTSVEEGTRILITEVAR